MLTMGRLTGNERLYFGLSCDDNSVVVLGEDTVSVLEHSGEMLEMPMGPAARLERLGGSVGRVSNMVGRTPRAAVSSLVIMIHPGGLTTGLIFWNRMHENATCQEGLCNKSRGGPTCRVRKRRRGPSRFIASG